MDADHQRDSAPGSGEPDPGKASAQGWQRIQLAALGFIGFCGVMWAGGSSSAPEQVQWLASGLAVSAFVIALVAIYLVGVAAYPVHESTPARSANRLRTGIRLTYLAVAVIVAATLTAWWPGTAEEPGGLIEVRASGAMWCGELLQGPPAEIRLDTADGVIDVPVAAITLVAPVGAC